MDKNLLLTEVKLFKGIASDDTTQDELIRLAISESIDRVLAKINEYSDDEVVDVPKRLTFVVRDVAIKRFNRLNSEGTTEDSEEGRSFKWDNYLKEYESTIKSIAVGKRYSGKGIARFI
ncbi:hypothetical protein BKX95_00290 [Streptococcus iniae]|nr:hypothetical protein BKX95_00290 [Streptococcus iniae]